MKRRRGILALVACAVSPWGVQGFVPFAIGGDRSARRTHWSAQAVQSREHEARTGGENEVQSVLGVGEKNTCGVQLQSAAANIPHPAKVDRGGEDAYFVLENDIGVFDGVGGWAGLGDPGLYSKVFANLTMDSIRAQRERGIRQIDVSRALKKALMGTKAIGSTTACVASLVPSTGTIIGLNLGDSGFILMRRSKSEKRREQPLEIVYRTRMQTHEFNMPFQLGTNCSDQPEDGQLFSVRVERGDLVMLATDGVWDNMFDEDILRIASKHYNDSCNVMALAIAEEAFRFAGQSDRISPWQSARSGPIDSRSGVHRFAWRKKEAQRQAMFGLDSTGRAVRGLGGKRDDITVIMARIV